MQSNNAVAVKEPAKPMDRFKEQLVLQESTIRSLLPNKVSYEKFQAIVVSAVADNLDLLDCDRGSLIKACLQAAELGLVLNKSMAEADILKVWNGRAKRNEAQFRPRYKGLMKLALQSGEVLKIESRLVYEKDDFEIIEGTHSEIVHKRKLGNRGERIGAYCVWTLRNGEKQFEVMSGEEILAISDRSSSKNKDGDVVGPWKTDEAEMWRKTVVRRATKYMPLSPEALRAVSIDNRAEGIEDIEGDGGDDVSPFDITDFDPDTGEVFEAFDTPLPAPTEAAESQLDAIAHKVAKPAAAPAQVDTIEVLNPSLDDDGNPDWIRWCAEAREAVFNMRPNAKSQWRKLHLDMLDEAELMEPKHIAKLIEELK